MPFTSDLKFGQRFEELASDILKELWGATKCVFMQGKFLPYDFTLIMPDDSERRVEVKADRLAHRTGNICIEHACSGHPSGITSSKSDYWVHFVTKKKSCL